VRLAIEGMARARRRVSAIANIQHAVRCYPGRVLAYAVMKQLLLLTLVAFASEAMAQDAQCVPERAAMVENYSCLCAIRGPMY
jgi:hypothetical protein